MNKRTKILITCVIALGVIAGGVFLLNKAPAQDTGQVQSAQGIQAGEDTATVGIQIQDDAQSGAGAAND